MKNLGLLFISAALIMLFRPDLFSGLFEPDRTVAPSRELQKIVEPVCRISISQSDSERLAAFYRALADVIVRDEDGIIKSGAEVRLINERAGRLCFEKSGIAGRYPNLAEAIDAVIGYGTGSKYTDGKWEAVSITPANRKGLADALNAVAWACEQ